MTTNIYDALRSKIARANINIDAALQRRDKFFASHPYEIFKALDNTGTRESLKVRLLGTPDHEIALDAAEAVYHLRSTLDQLMCALALANGATNTSGVSFPFAGDEKEFFNSKSQSRISKLSAEAAGMVCLLKPYRGGDDLLWGLGKLANIDKHISLIAIGHAKAGLKYQITIDLQVGDQVEPPRDQWQPLAEEMTLITYPAGRTPYGELEIVTEIAFGNIAVFAGEPVVELLHRLSTMVAEIIDKFEASFPSR